MECSVSSSFSDSNKKNIQWHSKKIDKIANENAILIQKNTDLTNQLTNIRKQFDQALDVKSKIENIYSTNSEYCKEIARLKSERDDLYKRLQISLQNNQDLNSKLQSLANSQSCSGENLLTIKKQKEKYNSIISELQNKLDEVNSENENLKNDSEKVKNELENIFQASSFFFKQNIDSPQLLLQSFIHGNKSNDADDIAKLTKHIFKLQNKLKKRELIIENFEKSKNQHEMDIKTMKESETEFNFKISELTAQIKDLNDRNSNQVEQINELTQQNEKLIEEISQKKAQIKANVFENEDNKSEENHQLNSKLISTQKLLAVTAKKNKKLKNKLFIIVCKAKSLEKKVLFLKNTIKKNELRKNELKSEIQRNADLHTQSEFKIKDIEDSVLRAKDELNLEKKENDRLHEEITKYENKLRQAARDYKELQEEKNHLISIQQQFDGKIQAYESKLQAEKIHQENIEKKLRDELVPIDASNIIPLSILNSSDFPTELQNLLGEIGRNSGVNLTVKVQSAFSTIAKFFKSKFDSFEDQIKEEHQKFSGLKTQIDALLDFLSRLFPEVKINFELILSDDHTRNILGDTIRNLKEIQRIQPLIEGVNEVLEISKFEDARTTIDKLIACINELQKEVRKQKYLKKKAVKSAQMKEEELNNEIKSIRSECDKLNDNNKELFESKSLLQEKIFSLQSQMKVKEEELSNMNNIKMKEMNEIISDLQNKLKITDSLKETISKLTKSKERLEQELKRRQSLIEDDKKKYKQKVKIEKDKYDQLLNQTKKQLFELQAKIGELTDANSKLEASNSVLFSNNNEMVLRIKKLETKLMAVQSEYERDKKSIESQCTAKLLFAETEFKSRIDEKQLQVDILKKRLIDSLAKTFASYLDGLVVDEKNFEAAIQLIKRKLDTIMNREAAIRGRFNLDINQPLEEFIASLISKRRKSNF